ncbi:MAG: hypothetical protein ABIP08_05640 [Lautropia sp.]
MRIGLFWLISLALLLPLAQATTSWHGFSHPAVAGASETDGKAPHPVHCGLCIAGAAVVLGGFAAAPINFPPAPANPLESPTAQSSQWRSPIALAYRSRAPPLAS